MPLCVFGYPLDNDDDNGGGGFWSRGLFFFMERELMFFFVLEFQTPLAGWDVKNETTPPRVTYV